MASHAASAQNHPRTQIMDSRDLKPGMKGYGLSVFSGSTPERFDVTILGVAENYSAGTDLILVELNHPLINEHGVVAGMSGSPVYIEGKLIGAVAFGWGWSNRPVGGIQPIKGMLEILDGVTEAIPPRVEVPPAPADRDSTTHRGHTPSAEPVRLPAELLRNLGISEVDPTVDVEMRPLATPVLMGSSNPAMAELFRAAFPETGLLPLLAGGGGSTTGQPLDLSAAKMVDGGVLMVNFCEGDLAMSAIGTVTFVEGDRLVGFGHPMIGFGNVDMPVSTGEVKAIIPSMGTPFKVGSPGAPAGALRQDRSEGVGVTLRVRPELVPLRVRVSSPETGVDRTFNYRLWDDRYYMPGVAGICLAEAISTVARESGPMTIDAVLSMRLDDGTFLRRRMYFSGDNFVSALSNSAVQGDVSAITTNPVAQIGITSMEISASIGDKLQFLGITDARLPRTTYRPGETARGTIQIEGWRQEVREVEFSIEIPPDTPDGRYEVVLADNNSRRELEYQTRPELARLRSREDLYARMRVDLPGNVLWCVLYDGARQLVVDERGLGPLPRSVAALTAATTRRTNGSRVAEGRILAESETKFGNRIVGVRRIPIEVSRRVQEAPNE